MLKRLPYLLTLLVAAAMIAAGCGAGGSGKSTDTTGTNATTAGGPAASKIDGYVESDRLAVDEDGNIYVAGAIADVGGYNGKLRMVRMRPDGKLDKDWGDDGIVDVAFDTDGFDEFKVESMVTRGNGDLLVAGRAERSTGEGGNAFGVIAVTRDGDVDKDFGDDGQVVDQIFVGDEEARPHLFAIDDEDRLYLGGTFNDQKQTATSSGIRVVRLTPDGDRDPEFAEKGTIGFNNDPKGEFASVRGGLLDGDGNITVLLNSGVVRFDEDGTYDSNFGTTAGRLELGYTYDPDSGGIQATVGPVALALTPGNDADSEDDDRYVLGQQLFSRGSESLTGAPFLTAQDAKGAAVDDFDGNAIEGFTGVPEHGVSAFKSDDELDVVDRVELDGDGRLIVAGVADDDGRDIRLVRVGDDGRIDTTFGDDGAAQADWDFADINQPTVAGLVPLDDGSYLAMVYDGGGFDFDGFALYRFTDDGKLDPAFGDEGVAEYHTDPPKHDDGTDTTATTDTTGL
jgi:uncharacterized delta-60 repeat protein